MINPLVGSDAFLEYVIYPLFLTPLQIPWSPFMFFPFAQAQCFVHTVAEGGLEDQGGAE